MKINIPEIKRLSEKREDENWRFRSFLKGLASEKIDALVQELLREFSSKIDCRACSNCCKEMPPTLDERDIETLGDVLRLTKEEFKKKYLIKDDKGYCFKTKPCPFLQDDGCSYYEHRPKDCRSYPHLHKKDFVFRLMGAIDNCSVCPIVFNVYESLKEKYWRRYG